MTAATETAATVAPKRFDWQAADVDAVFQSNFRSVDCLDALARAQAQFDPAFPGWALYRRVLIGDALLDRPLKAYAIGMARGVTRSLKANGRYVVGKKTRRGGWVAQAGLDGLDYGLFGRFPCGPEARAEHFGLSYQVYQTVRNSVAGGIWVGIATFQATVHSEYFRIIRARKFGSELLDV